MEVLKCALLGILSTHLLYNIVYHVFVFTQYMDYNKKKTY